MEQTAEQASQFVSCAEASAPRGARELGVMRRKAQQYRALKVHAERLRAMTMRRLVL